MSSAPSKIKIVKTSGDLDFFDPNLIASDCIEAGIDFWTAAEVALEVSKKIFDGISTEEIQTATLEVLRNKNPEAAQRYKRFHSMYVRTSRNTIDAFDRKQIEESLVQETTLPREIASNIARETEMELRRLNLEFISAPLIREMVNVKLLTHGFEEARRDYTRLGMPVHDAMKLVSSAESHREIKSSISSHVLKEYTLLKMLPLHYADSHMNGQVHIHSIEDFAISTGDVYYNPGKLGEDSYSAVEELFRRVRGYRELSQGSIFLPSFTDIFPGGKEKNFWRFFLKEAWERGLRLSISTGDRDFSQVAEIYSQGGKLPELYVSLEGGGEELLSSPHLDKITFWNPSSPSFEEGSRFCGMDSGREEALSSGLKVTVNLPRIAYLAQGEEKKEREFFQELHNTLSLSREITAKKKEVLERRGMQEFRARLFFEVGFLGLNEACLAFTGKELHQEEGFNFASRVLTAMKSTLEDWNRVGEAKWLLVPTEEREVSRRLAKLDFGLFPGRIEARGDRSTGNIYYSPGFNTRVEKIAGRVELHSQLQKKVHSLAPLSVKAEGEEIFRLLKESSLPAWRLVNE